MGRIVGAVGVAGPSPLAAMLRALSAGAVDPEAFSSASLGAPGAEVGWAGRGRPSLASDGPRLAAFDGDIYNRAELGGTGDDAALLLSLAAAHGFAGALERVNGDFACALYDGRTGELWLGRDRFGLKPLFYARGRSGFAFASRPRALFAVPGVSTEPRREFVALFAGSHYRTFDNAPEASPYRDVAQLPAAHWLRLKDGSVTTGRYWTLEDRGDSPEGEDALARRYRELLMDSVALRLKSAPQRVFTLSGGMDSSSVLACAVRSAGAKQQAVSTVYEDATYDESAEIKTILGETVETWHTVKVGTPDVEGLTAKMVLAHDEPVATATWLSHYELCGAVRDKGFRQVFGGLGGDELNAGEYEYFFYFFADLAASKDEAALEHETSRWIAHHDHPVFKKTPAVMRDGLARLVDLSVPGACRPDLKRLLRYAPALNPAYYRLDGFVPVMDRVYASYLKNRTHHDLFRETLPCCVRAQDRHGEAFGLSHILPFLDHRLVELMFRVPSRLKIRDGVTKYLLRRAMEGVLPDETRNRVKKTGWNAPAHVWFSGKGRDFLMDLVRSRSFRERGVYDAAEVERLAADHERIVSTGAREDNHMMFFWQLVNLELWLRSVDALKAEARP